MNNCKNGELDLKSLSNKYFRGQGVLRSIIENSKSFEKLMMILDEIQKDKDKISNYLAYLNNQPNAMTLNVITPAYNKIIKNINMYTKFIYEICQKRLYESEFNVNDEFIAKYNPNVDYKR